MVGLLGIRTFCGNSEVGQVCKFSAWRLGFEMAEVQAVALLLARIRWERIELPGRVVQVLRCSTDVALRYCGKMSSLKELPTGFLNQWIQLEN
jgi:hypothetical protein